MKINHKKHISLLLVAAMLISIFAGIFATPSNPTFSDVPADHWSYSYVERAAKNGWVNGVGNNRFAPAGTLTFSEFYTMIVPAFLPDELAAYQAPGGSPWWQRFMWVGANNLQAHSIWWDLWYDDDIQTLINKYATQPISRSDAISIMWRVLEYKGLDKQVTGIEDAKAKIAETNGELSLMDGSSVPVCYAAGLISGNERGELNLQNTLTRAEGCVMLCNLADYVAAHGGGTSTSKPVQPDPPTQTETPAQTNPPAAELGQKLDSGATAAAGVKSSIGKKDDYPTYGNSDVVSNNGYYTGATNVDIGGATLQYSFLDLVNEARVAEGHTPFQWVSSDAAEEHTLQRCYELVSDFSHVRPKGKFSGEVIAKGQYSAEKAFTDWMNSPGHKRTLMSDTQIYMSAARAGSCWIICTWSENGIEVVEQWSSENYDRSSVIEK
ncbi:S-layer homology domain-containing protein [Intestinimonas massiliensis (ex Afouda et al. 2020)]|uniref:S-layer homology domain-containing protein n=1 Tax=Intestinimonas massiliensis (ex Afouda et al. 2020) TaxID=1673721 RepID=A0ABS9M6B5_9FIRM|nr:S-layer homology domain-containing protein [Intestinimonas massiliensis (ex Afouda et al. 2020)]MCG4526322.1 S-layer homology domain-containing protein [Intestinimonas massiliensis (ex Afouda et al. 2020)]